MPFLPSPLASSSSTASFVTSFVGEAGGDSSFVGAAGAGVSLGPGPAKSSFLASSLVLPSLSTWSPLPFAGWTCSPLTFSSALSLSIASLLFSSLSFLTFSTFSTFSSCRPFSPSTSPSSMAKAGTCDTNLVSCSFLIPPKILLDLSLPNSPPLPPPLAWLGFEEMDVSAWLGAVLTPMLLERKDATPRPRLVLRRLLLDEREVWGVVLDLTLLAKGVKSSVAVTATSGIPGISAELGTSSSVGYSFPSDVFASSPPSFASSPPSSAPSTSSFASPPASSASSPPPSAEAVEFSIS
mmetsp:Transcript_366/g.830  ORF Transcript_366/g.830 Transcript_366/m.830 type:complete len:296 (-) Transcript_366:1154-2041(-)